MNMNKLDLSSKSNLQLWMDLHYRVNLTCLYLYCYTVLAIYYILR